MSIRKREWVTQSGNKKEGWILDYFDNAGIRRQKGFATKKAAESFSVTAKHEIKLGTHTADSASITVSAAGELWITTAENNGLERSSVAQYRQHLDYHLTPFLGKTKLNALSVPLIRQFEDDLSAAGRSAAMVRKVRVSLGSLLADAQERGLVARNVVRDLKGGRHKGKERRAERRQKGKLKVGVDIPTREEIKAIIGALQGRYRPLLLTAIFTGLRASELRGLRWVNVDFEKRELHVVERADRYDEMGQPKSEAGERSVPIPPIVVNTLKEWKLACPKRATGRKDADGNAIMELDLVFPNGRGHVESRANIVRRGLWPTQVRAGVCVDSGKLDEDGNPVLIAKYKGLHALRHFYASWCINRTQDGGLNLPPKSVQERMGHASITLTLDTYSHLFPRGDDADEMAAAENALLA
ncbi:Site-specific recombinase XerD [Phyllobacterium sp. YR620]|uniref:tyrosine-type recombinase/integrase n=1 Tax=Phyllobacterium sp. YR620 TaxID=1881066 RepID=UPI0008926B91|nr:site-specific integrase [Phyllobacterium sp. YR620]SDP77260.1 Site-specific recombinase XerD [Phyllobacterium sp. YR620]